jgi:hypothetical protein
LEYGFVALQSAYERGLRLALRHKAATVTVMLIARDGISYRCPAGERLTRHFSNVEEGLAPPKCLLPRGRRRKRGAAIAAPSDDIIILSQ